MATLAPSVARRLARAAPMPREPPVTSAIFPSSFLFMVCLLFLSRWIHFVSVSIKLRAGQDLSSDLFTYRYEIRNPCTARPAALLRSGHGPGSRDARFLGQRLRRRIAFRSHKGYAHQSTKSLRRIWQQGAALWKSSRSLYGRAGRLFWQSSGGTEGAGCGRRNIPRHGQDGG